MAISALRRWRNGEVFTARDYMYEREEIVAEVNRLAGLFTGDTDLTVNSLTTSSITMGGQTATAFEQIGNKTFLSSTEPTTNYNNGDLWFDTSE